MYGHDDDQTGELPRVDPHQSWTFDQHPVGPPHQSPRTPDEPTTAFAVPSSHRGSARYAGGYRQAYDERDLSPQGNGTWWRSAITASAKSAASSAG